MSEPAQKTLYCSFCFKSQFVVKKLISGPARVFICDECVDLCNAIIADRPIKPQSLSAEGLPTEPGRPLLLADGAEAFADAVLRAVPEPELRRRLEREARTLVTRHYDWSVAARLLELGLIDAAVADAAAEPAFTRGAAAARTLS